MKNLLAVFMIAATGNVAAEDCTLVGLMAETVMQSRQYGWGIQLDAKTQLQKRHGCFRLPVAGLFRC